MREITIKVYSFDELSSNAQEKAIEAVRQLPSYDDGIEYWAIDDCALFEPTHKDLVDKFGDDYNFPLIKNNREGIYYSVERGYLNITDAIEITNDKQFLRWLGLGDELINKVTYSFYNLSSGCSTEIRFDDIEGEIIDDCEARVLDIAISKFNNHIKEILSRINNTIEYHYSDESVIDTINDMDYEFYENGEIYKIIKYF